MSVHGDHVLFYVKDVPGPPGENCLCSEADSEIGYGNKKPVGQDKTALVLPFSSPGPPLRNWLALNHNKQRHPCWVCNSLLPRECCSRISSSHHHPKITGP